MIDINHMRALLGGGMEDDLEENRSEDSSVTILSALPELLDELEAYRSRDNKTIVDKLESMQRRISPAPWEQHYGYNNGGCPTAFFKIPGHNGGAEVEMLAEDAAFIVEVRSLLPDIIQALKDTPCPTPTNTPDLP